MADSSKIWLTFVLIYTYKQFSSEMKGNQMVRKSKRRAWTKADVRKLKTFAKKKMHASSIAQTLKRTEGATRQKAFSIGLSLESRI